MSEKRGPGITRMGRKDCSVVRDGEKLIMNFVLIIAHNENVLETRRRTIDTIKYANKRLKLFFLITLNNML